MPNANKKSKRKRACAKCGRAAQGHPGPLGHARCVNSPVCEAERDQGQRSGVEGELASRATRSSQGSNVGPMDGVDGVDRLSAGDPQARARAPVSPLGRHLDEGRREQSCPPTLLDRCLDRRGDVAMGSRAPSVPALDRTPGPRPMAQWLEEHRYPEDRRGWDNAETPRPPQQGLWPMDGARAPRETQYRQDFSWPNPCPGERDFRAVRGLVRGTEHLSDRTRNAALSGEFVDLCDFLCNALGSDVCEYRTSIDAEGNLSVKPVRQARTVSSLLRWIEAWTAYELLLCSAFGADVFQEMARYRMFIVGLFHRYRMPFVLSYDYRHRRALGAERSFNFSALSSELYITTFDSAALRVANRCGRCSSAEHSTQECPFRVPGQGDLPRQRGAGRQSQTDRPAERSADRPADRSSEICYLFQEGRCRAGTRCGRRHACISCGGADGLKSCQKCSGGKQPPKSG